MLSGELSASILLQAFPNASVLLCNEGQYALGDVFSYPYRGRPKKTRPRGYTTFFKLNSTEHKISTAHKTKIPTNKEASSFKAAYSVTFDLLSFEKMFLFFKNTVKKLNFRYTFYQFRNSLQVISIKTTAFMLKLDFL